MNNELSKAGNEAIVRALDRAEVLVECVAQLRKDLGLAPEELPGPDVGEGAFEALRTSVLQSLDVWSRTNSPSLSRAINRVDLTERMVNTAMDHGGLAELARLIVVRCLQKVLSRHRYAGRY